MTLNTYTPLSTTTVASNTSAVTLSLTGITGYTDLQIVINAKKGENSPGALTDMHMRFNGDTGTNYSWTAGSGYVSGTISPTRQVNTTNIYTDYYAELDYTNVGVRDITIFNYSATDMYKTVYVRAGKGTEGTDMIQGLYRGATGSSKEAITSITFTPNSGTIAAGSVFTVYGIGNTLAQGAKANGGIVYQDTTYYYHVFNATGVFTPLSSLTADVLVVAGGGGGGSTGTGGGGGAGGFLGFASQSLSATSYTCTVGAGGAVNANGGDSQFGALTLVKGGGYGVGSGTGATGGSGGGGGISSGAGGSATSGQGNAGGAGFSSGSGTTRGAGGGGGAGAVGGAGSSGTGGSGGVGLSTYNSWSNATGVGELIGSTYYLSGGGGGGSSAGSGTFVGGYGGGGYGSGSGDANASAGKSNTGGGGGGGGTTSGVSNSAGGAGGSGVIIIRYAK